MEKTQLHSIRVAAQRSNVLIVVLTSGFMVAVLHTLVIGKQPSALPDLLQWKPTAACASNPPEKLSGPKKEKSGAVRGYGTGGYLFVHFSTYRGGNNTFAVVGLGAKPVHIFGQPGFLCEWIPHNGNAVVTALGQIYKPDYGFGRVYTVVVVNCTFTEVVGAGGDGGKLVVHAWAGENYGENDTFVALTEQPGSYNPAAYREPYPYKFVYCGSPLYGELNPVRIHEWVTYHTKLFGNQSLIVLYDAGGVDAVVRKVLKPWLDSGAVVVHDVREQTRFDGYYYNQFMLLNDCHQRMRLMAPWIFFFDVDEYIYIAPQYDSLETVMHDLSGFTQVELEQSHMSDILCLANSSQDHSKQWGFEKLVFRRIGPPRDYKYAIQPQGAMSVGVHHSQNIIGRGIKANSSIIRFYHYHGTINQENPCKIFVQSTPDNTFKHNNDMYVLDTGLQELANSTKQFEMHILENYRHENKTQM